MRRSLLRVVAVSASLLTGSALLFAADTPAPVSPPSPASPPAKAPPSPASPASPPAKTADPKAGDSKTADPNAPAAASGSSAVLVDKGLNKTGPVYTLRGDKDVVDGMKAIATARTKMGEETKNRAKVEAEIKRAKAVFSDLDFQRRNLLTKLQGVKDVTQNNQLVAKIEVIDSQMKEAQKYHEDKEAELAKIGEDNKTKYVNLILDTGAALDKTEKDYADLSKDDEVKKALDEAKGKLGPTAEFVAAAGQLKRLRQTVTSETIDVKMEGGVPLVQVTLNKSFTREFVFDSGSSTIAIPASLAKQMELVPLATDPIVRLTLADGKQVQARQTTLKSVRVGSFTVENVECAILPPELVAAEPLLGGSFLQHFTYKLDPKAGKLHLAQVGTGQPAAGGAAGTAKPK